MRKLFVLAMAILIAVIFTAPSGAGAAAAHRVVFIIGLSNYTVDGLEKNMDAAAFLENGRTYVPVRFLANSLGIADSDIGWDGASQTATLTMTGYNPVTVSMRVGSNDLIVGEKMSVMDVTPLLRKGRVYLPARFVAEAFGYGAGWDESAQAVLIGPPGALPEPPSPTWQVRYDQRDVSTSYGTLHANLIFVNMNNPHVEIRPVLAEDRIGKSEELSSMAERSGAVAAINGTYFNAYDQNDLLPHGTLAADHTYFHLGGEGTLGVNESNRVFIGKYTPEITGGSGGSWVWPNWWYAWGVNHVYSDDAIVIFTPAYKDGMTPAGRTCVTVRNNMVAGIAAGQARIPQDGYVIWYGPNNSERSDQFSIGKQVDYKISYKENPSINFKSAIGNYPLLLLGGQTAVGEVSESKLTIAAPRSFAGVDRDNILVLGMVDGADVWGLAELTKNLGLKDALNLDGGASCGLYYSGQYITQPGRPLSNCLAVVIN
ncbi:stalk domain-containing protein [Pelotomaculum propionicicum]|uniref:Copper amine oxidase-like N-terminal domain-containing protein n=1 Tax=Pelotomaculum propionicicum TaxID=258475 RepID=A0A4Y7RKK0_9FIRM|nr:stalk domain-containing protein [Pelotomaculum propionicicum]NLI12459.1 hypothetical protein [Peptococcaceae bacterium]TEB09505.1 hypothetical protein Pmgp_03110 [Pelotomaculum propionicicum]